ncbi:MAG: Fic family protein [Planctomycetota bacterium]
MARAPRKPPDWWAIFSKKPELLKRVVEEPEVRKAIRQADSREHYLHWTAFRHRRFPAGLEPEEAWALVKFQRLEASRFLPFSSKTGQPIVAVFTDPLRAALRRIDLHQELQDAGLRAGAGSDFGTYTHKAFFEEAYFSSRLEGADTTRKVALEMLRSGRKPRGRSERMILNNHQALLRLDEWAEEPLTPKLLCEIQGILTRDAIEDPRDCGVFRKDDEVVVRDLMTGEVVHHPPPHGELPSRVEKICAFAQEGDDDEAYLHPVVRAILLHFQIAYDHPFGDGNGRTARWVFLWSLIRRPEFWWVRFLPVSRMVDRMRESYYRAFLYAENDDFDATYLIRHQVRCLEGEMQAFARFLRRRLDLREATRHSFRLDDHLNVRQLALFDHLATHPAAVYTQAEHAAFHGVTLATAGRDLNELEALKLLKKTRQGRVFQYRATARVRRLVGGLRTSLKRAP